MPSQPVRMFWRSFRLPHISTGLSFVKSGEKKRDPGNQDSEVAFL